jgi:hypothetical protein
VIPGPGRLAWAIKGDMSFIGEANWEGCEGCTKFPWCAGWNCCCCCNCCCICFPGCWWLVGYAWRACRGETSLFREKSIRGQIYTQISATYNLEWYIKGRTSRNLIKVVGTPISFTSVLGKGISP